MKKSGHLKNFSAQPLQELPRLSIAAEGIVYYHGTIELKSDFAIYGTTGPKASP
jgi:hypothetical protein